MGYYASADGFIDYKWRLDEDEIREAEKFSAGLWNMWTGVRLKETA